MDLNDEAQIRFFLDARLPTLSEHQVHHMDYWLLQQTR